MQNEIEQLAQQNDMSIEFVTWFFNEKKANCGNVWFMMMAAMWEGWKGRSIEMDKLAAENAHLASRKQRLIEIIQNVNNDYCMCGDLMKRHIHGGCGYPTGMFDYHYDKWLEEEDATPATDRIVAGIKAEGVEEFAAYQRAITEEWACKEGHSSLLKVAESAELFAKQLRDGADK